MPDANDIIAEILRDDEYVLGTFGDTGPQGEKGDAATITIGSVVTGTPQTPASVTNSGTQYDAVLNFVIPKGDTGSVDSTTDPLQINTVRCATIKSYTTGENVCTFAQDLTTFGNATCPTKIIGSNLKASEDGNTFYDIITSKTAYTPNLLSFIWSDHLINNQSWLRADTFSWQDGTVYSNAYNHLVADYTNGTRTLVPEGAGIWCYIAPDGHRVVNTSDATQVTNIENLYMATGVAWYYILDIENQRFKLPRTKWGFTGLRDNVGNYVGAGLPNITGNFYAKCDFAYNDYHVSGAFKAGASVERRDAGQADVHTYPSIDFDASKSNSIYGNATTVQPPATQMYLYFYVGNFSQSAAEQTAGLNSELFNGKIDLNAANLSNAGKSLIAGLSMPSSVYDDLTLGASGSTYTAPANGWFALLGTNGGSNYMLQMSCNNVIFNARTANSGNSISVSCPAHKGATMYLVYDGLGSIQYFRFVYAEGSKQEAN